MRFATVVQIVVMTIVWCVGLFALDYYKNPQLWHPSLPASTNPEKGPRLTLWMNHLCCTGCLDDVRQALTTVPGIDLAGAIVPAQLLTKSQADQASVSLPDYGNKIELPVTDLAKLDFVAVDRALRDKGLVAGRIEFGGVEHFRLQAALDHLCCGMCERSTRERIEFLKAKAAGGQLRWLDSMEVNRQEKTITAYARYLQPGKTVDANEILTALNDNGYAPRSLRVLVGEEMKLMSDLSLDGNFGRCSDSNLQETALMNVNSSATAW